MIASLGSRLEERDGERRGQAWDKLKGDRSKCEETRIIVKTKYEITIRLMQAIEKIHW